MAPPKSRQSPARRRQSRSNLCEAQAAAGLARAFELPRAHAAHALTHERAGFGLGRRLEQHLLRDVRHLDAHVDAVQKRAEILDR